MADAWGENNWGEGPWGQQSSITVSVTGLTTTTAIGTESVVGTNLVTLDSLQVTSALGTAVGEPEHVISPTGVSFETQLSGALAIEEGAGVVLGSLSTSFGIGTEVVDGTVDAGWGRSTWGSFAWNENIEFITNVSSVTMSTALGTPTVEVGSGVIVSATGLEMTSALGTTSQTGTALETLDSLTVGVALSGATVSGEGSAAVIAPSDQLDFAIGTPTIEIFTQVDPVPVTMTSALGTAVAEADALVVLDSLTMASALGTETVEVGTGVIVSVSTVALSFAEGTATVGAGATVNVTGVDLSIVTGNPFATPWANVVTGASNTWTEVDAA
tara:strand:+ start:148 stop:1134 length:987 start_codon:yes stop_codon:yes gene_type:complete